MASSHHIEAIGSEAIRTCWKLIDSSGSVGAGETLAANLRGSLGLGRSERPGAELHSAN